MANPIEMTDFLWLGPMTGTVDLQPNGFAEAGRIYPGPDGDRFYYGNYGSLSYSSLNGNFFILIDFHFRPLSSKKIH